MTRTCWGFAENGLKDDDKPLVDEEFVLLEVLPSLDIRLSEQLGQPPVLTLSPQSDISSLVYCVYKTDIKKLDMRGHCANLFLSLRWGHASHSTSRLSPSFSRYLEGKTNCLTRYYTNRQTIEPQVSSVSLEKRLPIDQKRPAKPPIRRIISTLDPQKLARSDFMDFSGYSGPMVSPDALPRFKIYFAQTYGSRLRFPPNTRGFLYYQPPPDFAPLAGEIRFRLVEGEDPTGFAQGSDLALPSGLPWHINTAMLDQQSTPGAQLLREHLMSPSLFRACKDFTSKWRRHKSILHSLGQPFSLNLGINALCVSRGRKIDFVSLPIFHDPRVARRIAPYRGRAIACFERSTLPEHSREPTLVLRLLKLLGPVECVVPNYDGYIPKPVEGSLVYHRYRHILKVWSYNSIDNTSANLTPLDYLLESH